jgi:gamma-glutamyl:cysteine ligase YbdK (ATP-grasp superfamily)
LFRAARWGVDARLPDARGELHEFKEVLDAALELAQPYGQELECEQAVARIPALAAVGGGAGRQRAVYDLSGRDSLLRDLIATTAQTARITQH